MTPVLLIEYLIVAAGLFGAGMTAVNLYSAIGDYRWLKRKGINGSRQKLARLAIGLQAYIGYILSLFALLGVTMLLEDNPSFSVIQWVFLALLTVPVGGGLWLALEYRNVRGAIAREFGDRIG